MRKLFKLENASLGWKDPIPEENSRSWVKLLAEVLKLPTIKVMRSLKPANTIGRPELFTFFDGSTDAYGTCVYVRWKMDGSEERYSVSLMASKARVTGVRGSTTPRSELSGLLLASRLLLTVVKAMTDKPSHIYICGDSQCTIAALQKSGDTLGPYFCNRVSETCSNLEELDSLVEGMVVDPVHHISGKLNPADLITRDTASASDLLPPPIH